MSARFWLIDCRQIINAAKFASELYQESIYVPFMAKFVIFAKRLEESEAQVRIFCMTDDKEEKTLENQEHFTEVAKSRDVEVLENKAQFLEFAGNLTPVTKSGEQLYLIFQAFRENRLPVVARLKDANHNPVGRIAFMRNSRRLKSDQPQQPICTLNVTLPDVTKQTINGYAENGIEKQEEYVPFEYVPEVQAQPMVLNGHSNGHDQEVASDENPYSEDKDITREAESMVEENNSDVEVVQSKSRSLSSSSSSSSSSANSEGQQKLTAEVGQFKHLDNQTKVVVPKEETPLASDYQRGEY